MDALSLINKKLNVEQLLHTYGFQGLRDEGDFIRCSCAIHDGNNPSSFVINRDTGLWFCHTSCGGGDAFTLVQKKEKTSFIQAVHKLASIVGISIDGLVLHERKDEQVAELQRFIKLMQRRQKKRVEMAYTVDAEIKPVIKYRNFSPDTLAYFKLGFVEHVQLMKRDMSTYTLRNRLVIPNFHNGIQHMLSFRATKASDVPKWSHQPVNVETGNYLYNYDIARYATCVIVVEGVFDVWAYHEVGIAAVATYGAHVTHEQYKLLLKTSADIVLSFDGDEAGRNATAKAIKLLKNKSNLSAVTFNEGADPESITRQELLTYYGKKRKV